MQTNGKVHFEIPKKALHLIRFFQTHSHECFLVGGFVRDQLLKRQKETLGLDFTTAATPEEMLALFPGAKYQNNFGTVIIPLSGVAELLELNSNDYLENDFFEVTTYRSEKNYTDARHPDNVVWGKTLTDDLSRRDFTINALATDGEMLIDKFDGQTDLHKKVIRTIGDPSLRFGEDALRLMRAVRFASELGFQIEKETYQAIKDKSETLKKVSNERIRDEFLKILLSPYPKEGVLLLKDSGLLQVFLPELVEAFKVDQVSKERHHIYDVGTHLINSLKECENPDVIVRLACLLHDIGKVKTRAIDKRGIVTFHNHEIIGTEIAYEIGTRLHLSKKQLAKLTKLIRYHQFTVTETQTDSAVRRFIRNVGVDNLKDIVDLRLADRIGSGASPSSWRTELFLKRLTDVQKKPFSISDLKIDGHDVMEILKIKPSRKVGDILDALFQKVVENKIENTRETLLKELSHLH